MTSEVNCKHQIKPIAFLNCETLGVVSDSYAQMPTPVVMNDLVRVFFSNRDHSSKSTIHFVDLNINELFVVRKTGKLNLELGLPGSFDDAGQMPSCINKIGEKWFMYYVGWNQALNVPYRLSIGLAESQDLTRFKKFSEGPILDRSIDNPFFVTTPSVNLVDNKFQMFYSRGNQWKQDGTAFESRYSVAHAESQDGITWGNFRTLDFGDPEYFCIARPTPIGEHLIYSRRPVLDFRTTGNGYRLEISRRVGVSEFVKCEIIWDKTNLGKADTSYAYPIEINGRWFIFFNGEGFGKSGIHIASIDGEL